MSIQDAVKTRCDDGTIVRFEPPYGVGAVTPPEGLRRRILYLSAEIGELFGSDDPRWWAVATDCLIFCEREVLTVRRLGYDRDAGVPAAMVRLEPRAADEPEEIWELRPIMTDPPL